jgi:hypothetical protein
VDSATSADELSEPAPRSGNGIARWGGRLFHLDWLALAGIAGNTLQRFRANRPRR